MDLRDEIKKYNSFKYERVSSKRFQEMIKKLARVYDSKKVKSEQHKI